ncbi:PREDICTED: uncharacterized protein LOC107090050 [Cyprinodon variegatus]|uniref:uncharacterized protein LOC107090050 n=1 Tax=Cyprinodon variegatus TaxID=28743 RepID=UPI000742BE4D|nr:PREDICTED: uncharacterized protein LOC107090050 [Cyprinodon variegatus]
MFFLKAEWIVLAFLLGLSGGLGKEMRICVLKGSTVNLTCFVENSSVPKSWHTVKKNNTFVKEELPETATVNYNISEDNTLIITDVQKSDNHSYCCQESSKTAEECWKQRTEIHVTDLQVKVFPATEEQKVTLMCKSSCPLTESPAAFIWYQNREFLYEDWSHWYRELVSSDQAVRYSCAIKGYEDLRSPEVSVDFLNQNCFGVRYPNVEVCPRKLKSAEEPCFIMYPKEVNVDLTKGNDSVRLTCNTSCPAADSSTTFLWYWKGNVLDCMSQGILVFKYTAYMSCGVHEYLHSDQICTDNNCAHMNYIGNRFCRLEESSVNISRKYTKRPYDSGHETWYKLKRNMEEKPHITEIKAGGRVAYHSINGNQHTLTINDLRKNDSGEYMFSSNKDEICKPPELLGAILVVTGLKVTIIPSDVVKEGQRVTLTCSTSCPLSEKTTYLWFFNEQPLSQSTKHNKHLILHPVRLLDAGNYSCAVKTPQNISSPLKALTVNEADISIVMIIMNVTKLAFLSLLSLVGSTLYLMLRKRRNATSTAKQC